MRARVRTGAHAKPPKYMMRWPLCWPTAVTHAANYCHTCMCGRMRVRMSCGAKSTAGRWSAALRSQ